MLNGSHYAADPTPVYSQVAVSDPAQAFNVKDAFFLIKRFNMKVHVILKTKESNPEYGMN